MAGNGPPPKHPSTRARRNNPKNDFTALSADGRKGKAAPAWPLQPDLMMTAERDVAEDRVASLTAEIEDAEDGRTKGRLRRELGKLEISLAVLKLKIEQATDAEVALWTELWATPQAVMWEQSHSHREVAQYVRWKIQAEQGDKKAASEARQLSDRLGLNPLALLRLRVEIQRADEAEDQGKRRRSQSQPPAKSKRGKGNDPRTGLYAVS